MALLERLDVSIGVISVGHANSFGHPAKDTLDLLTVTLDRVLRTDTVGWVSCRLREGSIAIATERVPTQ